MHHIVLKVQQKLRSIHCHVVTWQSTHAHGLSQEIRGRDKQK